MSKNFKIGDKVVRTKPYGNDTEFMRLGGVYVISQVMHGTDNSMFKIVGGHNHMWYADVNFELFAEVPQEDFKCMKFRVESTEHSKAIQSALFQLGYKWNRNAICQHEQYVSAKFLYSNTDGSIGYDNTNDYFENDSERYEEHVVTATTTYKIESVPKAPPRETIEFNGVFYDKEEFETSISRLKPITS